MAGHPEPAMLDLRILRDRWTEDGAREVFAELVTHCVRSVAPGAFAVRPDPGDEGLDTFVGEFAGDLHVYQAKYFCDGVGDSQRGQIRKSWKACHDSPRFKHVVAWTLCVPVELSTDEHDWWQGWRRRESTAKNCQIELWTKSRFEAFSCRPELRPIFDHALERGTSHGTVGDVLTGMRAAAGPRLIEGLPSADLYRTALFVRKLERAGWHTHRGARTAFYNFELLRTAVEQGGTHAEQLALGDLRERVYALWEHAFNEHLPSGLGRAFVAEVQRRVFDAHAGALRCVLPAGEMHKVGAVHDWADLCTAGWTPDHEEVGREADREDGAGVL